VIHGQMPDLGSDVAGCRFRERCPMALPVCAAQPPWPELHGDDRAVRCWRAGEVMTT
jgi:oligopeptide/dipeptide ABC transporter ATP-binding protein